MNKRPNAGWHMINWGLASGTVLAVLLIVFMNTFGSFTVTSFYALGLLINPFLWFIGLMFGGIPGAVLGAVESIFIGERLKDAPEPFTVDDMRRYRWGIYARAGAVPLVVHIVLSLLVSTGEPIMGLIYFLAVGIPVVIAMLASMYAAHRYMFRLRLYGMQHSNYFRKPKEKYKAMHKDDLQRLQVGDISREEDYLEEQLWRNKANRK